IADYLGGSITALGDMIRLDYSKYPNVERWLERVKKLEKWNEVSDALDNCARSLEGQQFVAAYIRKGYSHVAARALIEASAVMQPSTASPPPARTLPGLGRQRRPAAAGHERVRPRCGQGLAPTGCRSRLVQRARRSPVRRDHIPPPAPCRPRSF